ncbi:hypothetical protein R6242_14350 [Iodobacter sp. CM08]|uniref:hypothetical protein n=1 Tax=Iodobacter sp. CM08 TaxID=3085902 RepID=UPI0029823005|nr:hypothetical protein [Iodobacter sp. CM08]MDW5417748.1 hypothetical protein [Iodobacter sp. CM08]
MLKLFDFIFALILPSIGLIIFFAVWAILLAIYWDRAWFFALMPLMGIANWMWGNWQRSAPSTQKKTTGT